MTTSLTIASPRPEPDEPAPALNGSVNKVSKEEVLEILNDKDTRFSTTPDGVMQYAESMHLAGTIKQKPAVWSDMFIAAMKGRNGS